MYGRCDRCVHRPGKLQSESNGARLIPSLSLKEGPLSEPQAETESALVILLEELGANLIPGQGGRRVLIMRLSSSPNLLALSRRKRNRIRVLSGNTVPNVLGELNALGDGKAMEIGAGLAHKGSISRSFSGG